MWCSPTKRCNMWPKTSFRNNQSLKGAVGATVWKKEAEVQLLLSIPETSVFNLQPQLLGFYGQRSHPFQKKCIISIYCLKYYFHVEYGRSKNGPFLESMLHLFVMPLHIMRSHSIDCNIILPYSLSDVFNFLLLILQAFVLQLSGINISMCPDIRM